MSDLIINKINNNFFIEEKNKKNFFTKSFCILDNNAFLKDKVIINNSKKLANVIEIFQNEGNIKGVSKKLDDSIGEKGNKFRLFRDAESVAKNLPFSTAIVKENNYFYLYKIDNINVNRFLSGDNTFLDNKVIAVVKNKNCTLYNWSYETETKKSNNLDFAYINNSKIMINDKEYKISGLNVYDLAEISKKSQSDLEKVLKTISNSGANTIRFWAFSKNSPEDFKNIIETSRNLGLNLKFIPVLGNHWQHCESEKSSKVKDDNWYKNEYKEEYLPHVLKTVDALKNYKEILMIEIMNEPEAEHSILRDFADDVSTQIRNIYIKSNNIPHLISLGTLGGDKRKGMIGYQYKDLHGLPNIDIVTAHDYSFDNDRPDKDNISDIFKNYINYAKDLNKPFFIGEIGIKTKNSNYMDILNKKVELYKNNNISGVLLWGPQPLGFAKDGDGYGFDFDDNNNFKLKKIFKKFSNN